jgi:phosphorylase/glycogen(starch) synthase
MNTEKMMMPDYLFEASWEVCNKVGGIHTVLATKSESLAKDLKDRHILIGPDVWMETEQNPEFTPDPVLFRSWRLAAAQEGLRVRIGRWNVPSQPIAILVDYTQFIAQKDEILSANPQSISADTNFYSDYEALKAKLDILMEEWEKATEAIDNF